MRARKIETRKSSRGGERKMFQSSSLVKKVIVLSIVVIFTGLFLATPAILALFEKTEPGIYGVAIYFPDGRKINAGTVTIESDGRLPSEIVLTRWDERCPEKLKFKLRQNIR